MYVEVNFILTFQSNTVQHFKQKVSNSNLTFGSKMVFIITDKKYMKIIILSHFMHKIIKYYI